MSLLDKILAQGASPLPAYERMRRALVEELKAEKEKAIRDGKRET